MKKLKEWANKEKKMCEDMHTKKNERGFSIC